MVEWPPPRRALLGARRVQGRGSHGEGLNAEGRTVLPGCCYGVGGEEFVIVLPNTATAAAELIVARMLAAIRNSRPLLQSADFGYSFSAGIATAQPGDTPDDVLARADTALYCAKIAGRNRIHSAA